VRERNRRRSVCAAADKTRRPGIIPPEQLGLISTFHLLNDHLSLLEAVSEVSDHSKAAKSWASSQQGFTTCLGLHKRCGRASRLTGRSTIECSGEKRRLLHNYEHTLQVTMVGREILQGMTLSQRIEPTITAIDVACMLHDYRLYARRLSGGHGERIFVVERWLPGKRIFAPSGRTSMPPFPLIRSMIEDFCLESLGQFTHPSTRSRGRCCK